MLRSVHWTRSERWMKRLLILMTGLMKRRHMGDVISRGNRCRGTGHGARSNGRDASPSAGPLPGPFWLEGDAPLNHIRYVMPDHPAGRQSWQCPVKTN